MLPNRAPAGKELVYFPYWRFKGMTFACMPSGIKKRFVDQSYQAIQSVYFPVSVGFRSQTLKLSFATPEVKGLFLKPTVKMEQVLEVVNSRFVANLPEPILHRSYIGDVFSMLYAPFYVEERIIDAVLNKPVSPKLPDEFDIEAFGGGRPDWGLGFLPTQCPDCGWDLEGERDMLAVNCVNCKTLWQPQNNALAKLDVAYLPGEGPNLTYLPFWRIRADIKGIQLNTYADLIKVANLPRVVQDFMISQPFHFWAPAFKVRPESYLRLASSITLAQSSEKLVSNVPVDRRIPVNLPLKEAIETMKLNIANFMVPKQVVEMKLPGIEIKPESHLLVYLPCSEGPHEYLLPRLHLAINKNLLAMAKYL